MAIHAKHAHGISVVRERLLGELTGVERFTPFAGDVARTFGVRVEDARAALRLVQDPSAWQPNATPGISALSTPALAAVDVVIARLERGVCIPRHGHSAREITLVLDGLLVEDGARRCGPGDVIEMSEGSEHEIAVEGEHSCLAVFYPARL